LHRPALPASGCNPRSTDLLHPHPVLWTTAAFGPPGHLLTDYPSRATHLDNRRLELAGGSIATSCHLTTPGEPAQLFGLRSIKVRNAAPHCLHPSPAPPKNPRKKMMLSPNPLSSPVSSFTVCCRLDTDFTHCPTRIAVEDTSLSPHPTPLPIDTFPTSFAGHRLAHSPSTHSDLSLPTINKILQSHAVIPGYLVEPESILL
jgi:hypothetical protein